VKDRWGKIAQLGRRMFRQSADLGLALEALKQVGPYGTYRDRLEKLGISKSTDERLRKLALYREALPNDPQAELYGSVWTDHSALEFGKVLLDMPDDIPEGERLKVGVQRVRKARHTNDASKLSTRATRLEVEI